MEDTIIRDEKSAAGYDQQARETHWFGPEVVFGLAYEFIKPGDTLLDLGIGSGLSSILFHKAGLRVYGLDGSKEILEVIRGKGFAVELKLHDLRDLPLPYPSECFDHVISVAVLNSFRDLGLLFEEITRIIKKQGIFAFTVENREPCQEESYPINRVEVAEGPDPETAVRLFRHSKAYISQLLDVIGFIPLKAQEFLAFEYPAEQRDIFFKAYIVQKIG
jgi:ubiquinone/menaquinone biosynthesis C-methylase UbiE